MITTADYTSAVSDGPNRSGVSWGAIFAGAAGAAALTLILVVAGAGLGFSATSPWADQGASAKAIGISSILWLLVTAILASGLGGYIAGRLRVKWANLHGDEVYFRDTAHGFLSWAVATLVTTALIVGTAGNIAGAGAQAGASVASGAASMVGSAAGGAAANANGGNPMDYFTDTLFRSNGPASVSNDAVNGVANRILSKAMAGDGSAGGPLLRRRVASRAEARGMASKAEARRRRGRRWGRRGEAEARRRREPRHAAGRGRRAAVRRAGGGGKGKSIVCWRQQNLPSLYSTVHAM